MKRIQNFESFINEAAYEKYGTASYWKYEELKDELKDLKSDLKQAWIDMENDPKIEIEGGPVADAWGGKIEKLENDITDVEAKIAKMESKPVKKELTYDEVMAKETPEYKAKIKVEDAKKSLLNKIDDIKKSILAWPDRTIPEQAEIYKKRYGLKAELADIATALTELQAEKKI